MGCFVPAPKLLGVEKRWVRVAKIPGAVPMQLWLMASIKKDHSTFTSILSIPASIAALDKGKQLHTYSIKVGFKPWVVVGKALNDMYAKRGSIDEACIVSKTSSNSKLRVG